MAKSMKVIPGARQFTTSVTYPVPGEGYDIWTFTIPQDAGKNGLVEIATINHTNTSCGIYKMYAVRPDKTETQKSKGVQPGIASPTMVGKWKLFLKMVEPCGDKHVGITVNVRY